jgi:alpha(1,3/1,4) fucosyltransferase
MKLKIKINFTDFWVGFSITDEFSYFYKILSPVYDLEISENPDFLIYSCYGTKYLKYDCIKIKYIGENQRPDFTGCDYAFSFDYNNHPRHFRLPLYVWSWDILTNTSFDILNSKSYTPLSLKDKKFCCFIVSNPKGKKRNNFYMKLSKYKTIDSGGRYLNNIGGPVKNKLEFIKDYKFVIAFENSSFPGYTTEKIMEPFLANTIPIYWGNPKVNKEFNPKRFLNLHDYKTEDEIIKKIIELDNDDNKYISMLNEPIILNDTIPNYFFKENILAQFEKIFTTNIRPVSKTYKNKIHFIKCKIRIILWYTKKCFVHLKLSK